MEVTIPFAPAIISVVLRFAESPNEKNFLKSSIIFLEVKCTAAPTDQVASRFRLV